MFQKFQTLIRQNFQPPVTGQSLVEYGVVIGLVAIVSVGGMVTLGDTFTDALSSTTQDMSKQAGGSTIAVTTLPPTAPSQQNPSSPSGPSAPENGQTTAPTTPTDPNTSTNDTTDPQAPQPTATNSPNPTVTVGSAPSGSPIAKTEPVASLPPTSTEEEYWDTTSDWSSPNAEGGCKNGAKPINGICPESAWGW